MRNTDRDPGILHLHKIQHGSTDLQANLQDILDLEPNLQDLLDLQHDLQQDLHQQ